MEVVYRNNNLDNMEECMPGYMYPNLLDIQHRLDQIGVVEGVWVIEMKHSIKQTVPPPRPIVLVEDYDMFPGSFFVHQVSIESSNNPWCCVLV